MIPHAPHRRKFPKDTRAGITGKGVVSTQAGDIEFYAHVNFFPDGKLGEVFVKIAKQGSELSGWVSAWSTAVSIALQYGVPWELLGGKFSDQQFGGASSHASTLSAITARIDELVQDWHKLHPIVTET